MKRIVAAILFFAFITVNFSKVLIVVHYELNKKQLTEQFCVNKDKPEMHCCAKCLLKKKLAEDDAKQKSPALPDAKNDIQLFGSPIAIHIYADNGKGATLLYSYTDLIPLASSAAFFHPPCA
ncbi:MAG TPA: hypothetical protein VK783_09320 [Bacteroidia bacterium]|nr:hypothetical protein [Bacteroidia bacterium]